MAAFLAKGVVMKIWSLVAGSNEHLFFSPLDKNDFMTGIFRANGRAKNWRTTPQVKLVAEKTNKKRIMPDFGHISVGHLVLSERAVATTGNFFRQFGELLPINCVDVGEFFLFNTTNLLNIIDREHSDCDEDAIYAEAFFYDKVPHEPAIFNAVGTEAIRIYVNDAGKDFLQKMISIHKLEGLSFEMIWDGDSKLN
jgi:hypothetical protein